MLRLIIAVGLLVAVLAGTASAKSGSISNVHQVRPDGLASADYSTKFTSADCDSDGYCGWFPYAVQLPASASCPASGNGAPPVIYVGTVDYSPGTQVASETFYPTEPSDRLCLYITHAGDDTLVAETLYNPSVPAPPVTDPTSGPTVTTPVVVAPLGKVEARVGAREALNHRFGRTYARGKAKKLACTLVSDRLARCKYSFISRHYRYSGYVTVRKDSTGTEGKVRGNRRKV
jgi:hypothetical protein